jgi:hypothetical protein
MMRSIIVIFCVFCVATVLSEIFGAGLLWYRGQLTRETFSEMRIVLAGGEPEVAAKDEEIDRAQPSSDDVTRQRSLAILSLGARDEQLQILNSMIEKNRKSLLEDEKTFETARQAFEKQLAELKANVTSEATERARAILLAMSPADAVNHLMELDLKQCVNLVQGMQEKKAATILQEFFIAPGPKNDERIKRGHEILTAIGAGEPERKLIEEAAKAQAAGEKPDSIKK